MQIYVNWVSSYLSQTKEKAHDIGKGVIIVITAVSCSAGGAQRLTSYCRSWVIT